MPRAAPTPEDLLEELLEAFGHDPTADQYRAFHGIARFFLTHKPKPVFVLAGAAGTGKSTMVRAMVKLLQQKEIDVVLLAPTGRAARVLAERAALGIQANTIHSYIYESETESTGNMRFARRANTDPEPTVYIVDEASMIGDLYDEVSGSHLLKDLMSYVFDKNRKHQLILIGDPAQLPPIGREFSPALSLEYLNKEYQVTAGRVTLTEVRRQALHSGVLVLATALRECLDRVAATGAPVPLPALPESDDVVRINDAEELLEIYQQRYVAERLEAVAAVAYSNAMAAQINQRLRQRLLGEPEVLNKGDRVLVVRNHYRRLHKSLPLIANGDVGTVERVRYGSLEERYGQQWLDAEVEFRDARMQPHTDTFKLPVGLLAGKEATLTREAGQRIWNERRADLQQELPAKKRIDLKQDAYTNCLQLKFGYVLTAHKAQGGQWDDVIVVFEPYHLNRLLAEAPLTFYRWLYTAVTRARLRVYLYGWPG